MGAIKGICRETVMDLVREGRTYAAIAHEILCCSREQIGRIARAHGHHAAAIRRERVRVAAAAGMQKRLASAGMHPLDAAAIAKTRCGVQGLAPTIVVPPAIVVPDWAWEVHEDYRDHAKDFGVPSAERHCRRLLAEARAAERMAA